MTTNVMKLYNLNQIKYFIASKRPATWTAVFIFSIMGTIAFSETAHAGLTSFIGSILVGETVSAKSVKTSTFNSQTMPLPIAATNYYVNVDKSFDAVPIVGDTLNADIASTNTGSDETSNQISTYVVHDGDSYSSIAKMFNVSINTLLWANNLNRHSMLKVGQTLDILPVTGIKYTVQKNDTVLAIAKRYHADADEIYNYNDLDASSKLVIGQYLIIPDAEISITPAVSGIKRIKGQIYEPIIGDIKNLPSYPGYYACPVVGGRLTQELHGRNAIDLAATVGTPLKAAAAGTVIISKSNNAWNGGYGNFVVISHNNGTQTLYAHMQSSAVSVGDQVSQGQTVGKIGMTGLTTGPHTHFEIRGAKNPFAYTGCN